MMQHLPPKGSKGFIGANALPGVFMDNQPDAILRSYLCPSVAGGIQRLRVKIVIVRLDPFEFPLQDAFYLLYFQENKPDCQLP